MLEILFGLAILCEQLNLLVTGPDVRFRALDLVHERLDVVRGEMEALPQSHGFLPSTAKSVFTRLVPSLFSPPSLLLVLVWQTRQLQMRWGTIFPKTPFLRKFPCDVVTKEGVAITWCQPFLVC